MKKGTTKSHGNKHNLDKFYTKSNVAVYFINKLNISEFDCIIEPSAGCGSFSKHIPNSLAYDLHPEFSNIKKQDWLSLDKKIFKKYNNILVIGNPPFGTQGNLALNFIKESKFANKIAFILPKSFKKISIKNKIPSDFWLIYEEDVPKNSFTLLGEDYNVPCVFQIWEKRNEKRPIKSVKRKSNYFDFVTKENADFRIQRVGGKAGFADKNLNFSKESNYFIKNKSNIPNDLLIAKINKLDFSIASNTVGPKSLSKYELISILEKFIFT